jgi:hypothetical protein
MMYMLFYPYVRGIAELLYLLDQHLFYFSELDVFGCPQLCFSEAQVLC